MNLHFQVPAVNDTYTLLKESYSVYKGYGDTINGGTVAHNEFWIIDYQTTDSNFASNTSTTGDPWYADYPKSFGIWYHDRDEDNNYSGNTQNNIIMSSIGSKARWFTESSNAFGRSLSASMAEIKYSNEEVPHFENTLNDNNEMFTSIQKYRCSFSKWIKYWKYGSSEISGPFLTVAGEKIISCILPCHGFQFGNILGVVRYPPTDTYNNWESTDITNG